MKGKRFFICPFAIMEIVCAMGILILVMTAFYSAMSAMGKYQKKLLLQSVANHIFDNTLERISAQKGASAETAEKVFLDEFEKSGLADANAVKTFCEIRDDFLFIGIKDEKGKILAEIQLKIRKEDEKE
jgi:hypothetical protein